MRKQKLFASVLAICLAFTTTPLFAAGYALLEHGTKAMGMGNAFTAWGDDASTIYYNPAGQAFMEKGGFYLGGTLLFPTAKFAGSAPNPGYGVTAELKDRMFALPTAYYTRKVGSQIALGLGLNAPFALGVEWDDPENFAGRYISKRSELAGIYFTPSVAYQVNERIAFGANFNVVYSLVELEQTSNQPFNGAVLDVANITLEGNNGIAFGFDFGAMVKPHEKFQLGLVYKSKVENDYVGDAKFEQILTGNAALDAIVARGLPRNADGHNEVGVATAVVFPSQIIGGIKIMPTPQLSFEFDLAFIGWSDFDELVLDFESEQEDGDANTPENVVLPENYENTTQFRIGAEYKIGEKLALRAGYIHDPSPVPTETVSPFLPDDLRNDYTFGFGYKFGKFWLDGSYMFVDYQARDTEGLNHNNFNGVYTAGANLFSFSIGKNF